MDLKVKVEKIAGKSKFEPVRLTVDLTTEEEFMSLMVRCALAGPGLVELMNDTGVVREVRDSYSVNADPSYRIYGMLHSIGQAMGVIDDDGLPISRSK